MNNGDLITAGLACMQHDCDDVHLYFFTGLKWSWCHALMSVDVFFFGLKNAVKNAVDIIEF